MSERHEGARFVPDGIPHHLRHFRGEVTLTALDALTRQRLVFEHQVVGDRHRDDDHVGSARQHHGLQQTGLHGLDLAAVAAPTFQIEKQIVTLHQLGHICPQRGQVGGVSRIAPDRDRTGHMPVQQTHRPVEQVDTGRGNRGTDTVVIEHEQLDQIVEVALVIRDVDDAVRPRGSLRQLDMFGVPLDLAQDRIQRMLQGAIHRVSLGRFELFEIG